MNRNPYNTVFLIGLLVGSLGLLFGAAHAQSPACPGYALVTVQPQFSLNVRALPGGGGPILGTVTQKSGELRATEERAGFLHVPEADGWIVNRYLSVTCWGFGTPTPSVTAIPAMRTPQPTPTQIQNNLMWCSSEPEVRRIGDSWVVECKR